MPPIVQSALEQIGLSDKEISVLLALLQSGPSLAASIARAAKLNRTTTYGILSELAYKGLVSLAKKDGSTRYQSITPEMLPGYIERKREDLAKSKKELEDAIPQIMLLRNKGKTLPKVRFFEGAQGVEQAYEDMLENNNERMIYALTGLEGAVTSLDPKFMDYFISKRTRMGIKAEYIVPATTMARKATEDDVAKMRYAKFIPPEFNFNTEICIYDHKVNILSYARENPIALIIEDETIAFAMKQLFNYVNSTASST